MEDWKNRPCEKKDPQGMESFSVSSSAILQCRYPFPLPLRREFQREREREREQCLFYSILFCVQISYIRWEKEEESGLYVFELGPVLLFVYSQTNSISNMYNSFVIVGPAAIFLLLLLFLFFFFFWKALTIFLSFFIKEEIFL